MRIARLTTAQGPKFAELHEDDATLLDGAPWLGKATGGAKVPYIDGNLLCPVEPSKILCIGRNYALHAKEMGNDVPAEPLLFLKPPSSLLDPGGAIRLPPESARVEHEAELGVVLGKRCRYVSRENAL